jgi:WD40 repeat-containing protein SMU1
MDVDSTDVLRIILQFLSENGLYGSVQTLQDETGVALNAVPSPSALAADITSGKWDSVLQIVGTLKLPPLVLSALYEQILRELVELHEHETARVFLRGSAPLASLKQTDVSRYSGLEALVSRGASYGDAADLYANSYALNTSITSSSSLSSSSASNSTSLRAKRRGEIASAILSEIMTVPPSRLLSLVGQALKWQMHTGLLEPGGAPDLLQQRSGDGSSHHRSTAAAVVDHAGDYPCRFDSGLSIKFGAAARAEAVVYSHDGAYLIIGSVDGIVEVYDAATLKISSKLAYQARDEFMLHDEAISALSVSRDNELLSSASISGTIKVWRLSSGECLRKFIRAHGSAASDVSGSSSSGGAAVTCMSFSKDSSQLLSGGQDGTLKVYGLKSGKMLKEMRGHASSVSSCMWLPDSLHVVSSSLDGTVRVWDTVLSECTRVLRAPSSAEDDRLDNTPVLSAFSLPHNADNIIVVSNSHRAHLLSASTGASIRSFSVAKGGGGGQNNKASTSSAAASVLAAAAKSAADAICAASLSHTGRLLYLVTEKRSLFIFDVATGKVEFSSTPDDIVGSNRQILLSYESASPAAMKRVTGVSHHPFKSEVSVFGEEGTLKVLRASS